MKKMDLLLQSIAKEQLSGKLTTCKVEIVANAYKLVGIRLS